MKFVLCPEGYRTCLSQSRFLLFFSSPSRLLLVSVSSPSAIFFYQMVFANFLTFSHFYAPIVRPFACRKFSIALPIKKPAGDTVHTPPPTARTESEVQQFSKNDEFYMFRPWGVRFCFLLLWLCHSFQFMENWPSGNKDKKKDDLASALYSGLSLKVICK